jgi:hypothetical protein
MNYLLFNKNLENMGGTLCRVVPTQEIVNKINYNNDYKVIEISDAEADDIITDQKVNVKYTENGYSAEALNPADFFPLDEARLSEQIQRTITTYRNFNKTEGVDYSEWDNYISQLENFDTSSITYPLLNSLEKYFKDNNLPYLHPLQLY